MLCLNKAFCVRPHILNISSPFLHLPTEIARPTLVGNLLKYFNTISKHPSLLNIDTALLLHSLN